jgi:hypothetical protein
MIIYDMGMRILFFNRKTAKLYHWQLAGLCW